MLQRIVYILFTILISSKVLFSQTFSEITITIPDDYYIQSFEYADFDKDGLIDLFILADPNSLVYKNNGNNYFSLASSSMPGGGPINDLKLEDLNNDGYIDVVYNKSANEKVIDIYLNKQGFNFSYYASVSNAYFVHSTGTSDFDNDGDSDLFIYDEKIDLPEILINDYINQGEISFTNDSHFSNNYHHVVSWSDVDFDGDQDVMTSDMHHARQLFKNQNGDFSDYIEFGSHFNEIFWNSDLSFDFNNDGKNDFMISGWDGDKYACIPYKNDFVFPDTYQFEELNSIATGLREPRGDFGDIDNDGDADLILIGRDSQDDPKLMILKNNGEGLFMELENALIPLRDGKLSLVDFNNDNLLDIISAGTDLSNNQTLHLYVNDLSSENNVPGPPSNLIENFSNEDSVIFSWDSGSDTETPGVALTYNLYLYNDLDGIIVNPLVDSIDNPERLVSGYGNTGFGTSHFIRELLPGQYTWTVQTIDYTFSASAFAPDRQFTMPGDRDAPEIHSFSPITARSGDTIAIVGDHFALLNENNLIQFGDSALNAVGSSRQKLKFIIPENTYGPYDITVTVDNQMGTYFEPFIVFGDQNWDTIDAGFTDNFLCVWVKNESEVYIGGENGILIRTFDNSSNWESLAGIVTENINDIFFINDTLGWLIGNNGTLFKTIDRGDNWSSVTTGTAKNLHNIFSVNDSLFWMSASGGSIFKSSDTCNTWTEFSIHTEDINKIIFTHENTGYAISSDGRFFTSPDGGNSWSSIFLENENFNDIISTDRDHIFIVSETSNNLYYSTDGTGSWKIKTIGESGHTHYGIDINQEGKGYIVGSGGFAAVADNPEDDWIEITLLTTNLLNDIDHYQNARTYIVGNGGMILNLNCETSTRPVLWNTDKDEVAEGDTLIVYGKNFSNNIIDLEVFFDDSIAMVLNATEGEIQVVVPELPLDIYESMISVIKNDTLEGYNQLMVHLVNRFAEFPIESYNDVRSDVSGAVGDINNDGFQELILNFNGGIDVIYNIQSQTPESLNLSNVVGGGSGDILLFDVNKDQLLELFVSGQYAWDRISKLYFNKDNFDFELSDNQFTGLNGCQVSISDLNNDSYPDIIISGNGDEGPSTFIYKNNGDAIFSEVEHNLSGSSSGNLEFVDIDNDKDLDILLMTGNYGRQLILYRNLGDFQFEETVLQNNIDNGFFDTGDFDNDGDIDIVNNGENSNTTEVFLMVLENAGDGTFNDLGFEMEGSKSGSVRWYDHDNDGWLDIIISGYDLDENPVSKIYRNKIGLSFKVTRYDFAPEKYIQIADMNIDNKLDFIVHSHGDEDLQIPRYYESLMRNTNESPFPPTQLSTKTLLDTVYFEWNRGSDPETPPEGLYYNLRVGTTPGGNEVLASQTNPTTDQLLFPYYGSAGQNLGWKLHGLDIGTYYYSVQTIDPGYGASAFSEIKPFTIHKEADIAAYVSATDSIKPTQLLPVIAEIVNPGWLTFGGEILIETYLSSDTQIDAGDLLLHSITVDSLQGGERVKIELDYKIPLDQLFGNYYLISMVDPEDGVEELDTTNNIAVYPFTVIPDNLAPYIEIISAPSSYHPMDSILTIEAMIWDDVAMDTIHFYYTNNLDGFNPGITTWQQVSSDSLYNFNIERNLITNNDTIIFYLEADDSLNNITTTGIYTIFNVLDTIPDEIEEETPILFLVDPAYVDNGDTVTIGGMNFSIDQNDLNVFFDGSEAEILKSTEEEIQVIVPEFALNLYQSMISVIKNDTLESYNQLTVHLVDRFVEYPIESYGDAWTDLSGTIGDINNDGFLELLLNTENSIDVIKDLNAQAPGNFTLSNINGTSRGDIFLYDVNKDQLLDVFISGWCWPIQKSILYINKGDFNFEQSGNPFTGLRNCQVRINDLNNDSYPDIITSGDGDDGSNTFIYKNNGDAGFSEVEHNMSGSSTGNLEIVDIDNDNDLDILLMTGYHGQQLILYRNLGDFQFEETVLRHNIYNGFIDAGDYDNDGDIDIVYNGENTNTWEVILNILENAGDGTFTDHEIELTGSYYGAVRWFDYDNDGWLDIIITGCKISGDPASKISKIYRNESGISFIETDYEFTPDKYIHIADFNHDDKLDFIIHTPFENDLTIPGYYQSLMRNTNESPDPPTYLVAKPLLDTVYFEWNQGSDEETPSEGLYYNLRVGTTPEGNEVLASQTNPTTDKLLFPHYGNAGQNLGWKLHGLDTGTYYYSVQTIDPGYGTSAFSEIKSFTIHNEGDIIPYISTVDTIKPSQSLPIKLEIMNSGWENLTGEILVETYLSNDSIFDTGDQLINSASIDSLQGGERVEMELDYRIPIDQPYGDYYLISIADPEDDVEELDTTNNKAIYPIKVIPDNLEPYIEIVSTPSFYNPLDSILSIQAKIWDDVAMDSVSIHYTSISTGFNPGITTWQQASGDSTNYFEIDIRSVTQNDTIVFYIEATDSLNNVSNTYINTIIYALDTIPVEIRNDTPILISVDQKYVDNGDTITVGGLNFSNDIHDLKVLFDGSAARVLNSTEELIQAVVPELTLNKYESMISVIKNDTLEGYNQLEVHLVNRFVEHRIESYADAWSCVSGTIGDIDNDGYHEFLLNNHYTVDVINDFHDYNFERSYLSNVIGEGWGSIYPFDVNNDQLLDLFITGVNWPLSRSDLYYNKGNLEFEQSDFQFKGVYNTYAAKISDLNNDSYPDIIISGEGDPQITIIYKNNGDDTFVEIEHNITPSRWGDIEIVDIDNDKDFDILLMTGNDSYNLVLYENVGDFQFTEKIFVNNIFSVLIDAGDFDNDGDMDIMYNEQGINSGEVNLVILENTGDGTFYNRDFNLEGISWGSVKWFDYDNNGWLDIIVSGNDLYQNPVSKIYHNNNGLSFDETNFEFAPLMQIQIADMNLDNKLDFIVHYHDDGDLQIPRYYESLMRNTNEAPASPSQLSAKTHLDTVYFEWNQGSDVETPSEGLHYNLRIGTTPNGCEVLASNTHPDTDNLLFPYYGNVGQSLGWKLYGLDMGTYYYSVQTIDPGFSTSAFSEIKSFTIHNEGDIIPYISAVDTIKPSQSLPIRLEIMNSGWVTLTGEIEVETYLSNDSIFDTGDQLINSVNIDSLQGGELLEFELDYIIPLDQTYGEYYLLSVAKPDNLVEEYDSTNNIAIYPIRVIPDNQSPNIEMVSVPAMYYPLDSILHIEAKIWDDVAMDSVSIHYTNISDGFNPGITTTQPASVDSIINFDIDRRIVTQDDTIVFYIEATDSLKNITRTDIYTIIYALDTIPGDILNETPILFSVDQEYVDNRDTLTIGGMNFSNDINALRVFFDNSLAFVLNATEEAIQVVVPNCPMDVYESMISVVKNDTLYSYNQQRVHLVNRFVEFPIESYIYPGSDPSGAIGDIDNDGFQELLLTNEYGMISVIYDFHKDRIESINLANVEGGGYGDIFLLDVNKDQLLDLFVTGAYISTFRRSYFYINKDNYVFEESSNQFTDLGWNSNVRICDLNNDSFSDIIISGNNGIDNKTYIYQNIGDGTFTEIDHNLIGSDGDEIQVIDIENDKDLDIIFTQNQQIILYKNNGGFQFEKIELRNSIQNAFFDIGDFDNDGDIDIVYNGGSTNIFEVCFVILENSGNGTFNTLNLKLEGSQSGSVRWFDYDNDGWLDIIKTGFDINMNPVSKIYHNENGHTFEETNYEFSPEKYIQIADMNNDNKLDFIVHSHDDEDLQIPSYYQSQMRNTNESPDAPTNLIAKPILDTVHFEWNRGSDPETPPEGLYYNLRIGTSPGGNEVLASQTHPDTDQLLFPHYGNAGQNLGWTLHGLDKGTYHYSVQTIDPGYGTSAFSEIKSFTIHQEADITTYVWTVDTIKPTQLLPVKAEIINPGSVILSGEILFETYLSYDSIMDASDLLLQSITVDSLKGGERINMEFDFRIPLDQTYGEYYLISIADPGNNVEEFNENNNAAIYPFKVINDQFGPYIEIISAPTYYHPIDSVLEIQAKIWDDVAMDSVSIIYADSSEGINPGIISVQKASVDSINYFRIERKLLTDDESIIFCIEASDSLKNVTRTEICTIINVLDTIPEEVSTETPILFSVSHEYVDHGDTVTVGGMNFSNNIHDLKVFFDDSVAVVLNTAEEEIKVIVPELPLDVHESSISVIKQYTLESYNELKVNLINRFVECAIDSFFHIGSDIRSTIGDINNDGFPELLFANEYTKIDVIQNFQNDATERFKLLNVTGGSWGDMVLFDINKDQLLDLFITGNYTSFEWSRLYINEGNLDFTQSVSQFNGLNNSNVRIRDMNNDSYPDIILTGWSGEDGDITYIYQNNGNATFTEVEHNLHGSHWGDIKVVDVDNDLDNDIILMTNSSSQQLILYKNIGAFQFEETVLQDYIHRGFFDTGDFDNDGDMDIVYNGENSDSYECNLTVLENTGSSVFYEQIFKMEGSKHGSVKWFDYDNDGWLDIIITGNDINRNPISKIYRNERGLSFKKTGYEFITQKYIQIADVDLDKKLDFIVHSHDDHDSHIPMLYKSTMRNTNESPLAPTYLVAKSVLDTVYFGWNRGSDAETPSEGLYYNLRVGTTPRGSEILPSNTHPDTDQLLFPHYGNAGQNMGWKLHGLDIGTYYYSIQAIDPGYGTSDFTDIKSFQIHSEPDIVPFIYATNDINTPGYDLEFQSEIINTGFEQLSGEIDVQIYLSEDSVYSGSDILVDIYQFTGLTGGEREQRSHAYNVPNDITLGIYNLIIVADENDSIDEYNENNNVGFYQITLVRDNVPPQIDTLIYKENFNELDSILNVTAIITDNNGIEDIQVHIIQYGDGVSKDSTIVFTVNESSEYQFSIEQDYSLKPEKIIFYFDVVDIFNNQELSDAYEITYLEDTKAPVLSEIIYDQVKKGGEDLIVEYTVTDNSLIKEIVLYYGYLNQEFSYGKGRNIFKESFTENYTLEFNITDEFQLVYFYLEAIDYFDNKLTSEIYNILVVDEEYSLEISGGTSVKDYQIISIPFSHDYPISFLKNYLGERDKNILGTSLIVEEKWRLYSHENDTIKELSQNSKNLLHRGNGYWIISKDDASIKFDIIRIEFPFTLSLKEGWNLIGNPFIEILDWKKVRESNTNIDKILYSSELRVFRDGVIKKVNQIQPFEGA
ncbi:FG-GAP-like repeat-containing protein, partial [Bacteroidota bacterium]